MYRVICSSDRLALFVLLSGIAAPALAQSTDVQARDPLRDSAYAVTFDHATVLVKNLAASAAFYQNVLRLEPMDTPWGPSAPVRFFDLGSGRQLHMGVTDRAIVPNRGAHLAFAVNDFDNYLRFLTSKGVAYSNFAGTSSSPQVRPDGVRQVYLQDPDGNWIEINDVAR